MRGKISLLLLSVIIIVSIYIIASPVWGYSYYNIGEGPIRDIERDSAQGQLIIASGQAVYIVNAANGEVLDVFETPGKNIVGAVPAAPPNNMLYGIGGCEEAGSLQISINRNTGQVLDSGLPSNLGVNTLVQDSTYL
jgi:hypothetical protein